MINRLRSVVERVIAQVKCWRVLHSGLRRPLAVYSRVFLVVRGWCFGGWVPLINKPQDVEAPRGGGGKHPDKNEKGCNWREDSSDAEAHKVAGSTGTLIDCAGR
ncbi:hypothetical protein BHF80_08675 [Corynebacterium diphtheriae]|nr:hypothetical protein BHF80_08675 [Corynebacterium diphtheriae]